VEIWNSLPGVEPLDVPRFRNKSTAAQRIFRTLRSLSNGDGISAEAVETYNTEAPEPLAKPKKAKQERKAKADKKASKSSKKAKAGKKEKRAKDEKSAKGESKKLQVVNLLRKNGATLDEISAFSGWSKSSAQMFVGWIQLFTGFGISAITSEKNDAGERVYRVE
jgi:hypothetical protein